MGETRTPLRIQRKRTKGWRIPGGAVSVTRLGRFGNPFRIGHHYKRGVHAGIPRMGLQFIYIEAYEGYQDETYTTIKTAAEAVEWFEWYCTTFNADRIKEIQANLRGKDLACFCKEGAPCHADALLRLANA